MTRKEAKYESARRWIQKADTALISAADLTKSDPAGAINRAYYACFYAASAVLILDERHFVKHAGVRSAVHEHLVHTGRIPKDIGDAYSALMETRQDADYKETGVWTSEKAAKALDTARRIVAALRNLLPADLG